MPLLPYHHSLRELLHGLTLPLLHDHSSYQANQNLPQQGSYFWMNQSQKHLVNDFEKYLLPAFLYVLLSLA